MFRHTRLILAVLLVGCGVEAGEDIKTLAKVDASPSVELNEDLLATVDATLEVADIALDEILEDKIKTRNQIRQLQYTVNQEEALLTNLSGELGAKDSLLFAYQANNLFLEEKIQEIEDNLNHALHKCGNECYPTIIRLNQENQDLLNYVDSLQNWVFYLDSLVETNKKLSKKNTFPH
jgi:hypothetical protein